MQKILQHLNHSFQLARGMLGTAKAYTGPLWVQIGLSNPCNHRCIMCWDHPIGVPEENPYPNQTSEYFYAKHPEIDREHGFMDLTMLTRLADDLFSLGTRRIELVGRGEPTLHPQFEKIVKILKGYGFQVGLSTNGSLLTPERCKNLVDLGLDRIVVSLDAGTRETYPRIHTNATPGTYDNILANLKLLHHFKQEANRMTPQLMLSFVLSRLNFHEAKEMLERAREVAASQLLFKYVVVYPGIACLEMTDEEKRWVGLQLSELFRQANVYGIDLKVEPPLGDKDINEKLYHNKIATVYSKIPCYIGWFFSLITAEGSVIPCCQCMIKMGDLRQQSFWDIWHSPAYAQFRRNMKNFPSQKFNPSARHCECNQCAFEKINTTIYNKFHFYRPVYLHDCQREFTLKQLLPAILSGKTTTGAKPVSRNQRNEQGGKL